MMVEAGGTERSWEYYEDGAPKVTEEVLAEGLEAAKTWIRESIELQRELVAAFIAARGPIEPIESRTFTDYGEDVWRAGGGSRHRARSAKANTITAKAERNAAIDEATDAIAADRWPPSSPSASGEIKAAVRSLTKKLVRQRIVEDGRPHRRADDRPTSGRCRPRSTCSRRRTARRSSSGVRPRCST